MDIYLLQDGEKKGPYRIFQLREMLRREEASGADLGWHEGCESWLPLTEISSVSDAIPGAEMAEAADAETIIAESEEFLREGEPDAEAEVVRSENSVAFENVTPHPWRRWFARALDNMIAMVLVAGIGMGIRLFDLWELGIPSYVLLLATPFCWIFAEAWCLSRFAATPGKLLLGIRVTNSDGTMLTYNEGIARSLSVWFRGIGMGFPILLVVMPMMSYFYLKQAGRTQWDQLYECEVSHRAPGMLRIGVFALAVLCFSVLQQRSFAAAPEFLRKPIEEQWEGVYEFFESKGIPVREDGATPSA